MKKLNFKYVAVILFSIISLSSTQTFAQKSDGNLIDSQYFGFEAGEKSWFVQHKDFWSMTTEKAASGTTSLKFSCADISNAPKMMQVQAMTAKDGQPEKVVLAPGEYTVSVKVWLGDTAPSSFATNIASNKELSPFFPITWKLNKVEKNKWVELSQKITLESPLNSRMVITVSNNPKWGGAGVIYVDDIKITK